MKGKVKKIFHERGYGFIRDKNGDSIFFHLTDLKNIDFKSLEEGMSVEFETDMGTKGIKAENIRTINQGIANIIGVTPVAKKELKFFLEKQKMKPEYLLRITLSSSNPDQLEFIMDVQKEGDHVIKDNNGDKILLIGSDVVPELEGMAIDYRNNSELSGFVVTSRSSVT